MRANSWRRRGRAALVVLAVLAAAGGVAAASSPAAAGTVQVDSWITGVTPDEVRIGTVVDGVDRWQSAPDHKLAPLFPNGMHRSDQCITVNEIGLHLNGTRAHVWGCQQAGHQLWRMEPTNVTGLYRIRPGLSRSTCLDADNRDGGPNGAAVQLWQCFAGGGQTNQYWWVVTAGPGFMPPVQLVSNFNGRCLDIDNRRLLANGSVAQLWDCLGQAQYNQWFVSLITAGPLQRP